MTYIPPDQCAAQFEVYAESFDQMMSAHQARYKEYEAQKGYEAAAIRWYEASQLSNAREAAHQLRFCAWFLRENALLRWTKDVPTKPGYYWTRGGHGMPEWIGEIRVVGTYLVLVQGASLHPIPLGDLPNREWAGPIGCPVEGDQTHG